MKKLLLNYKSINYFFLLLLFCANSVSSQTVIQETFGSLAVITANNYNGATSTPAPSVNYVTNVAGYSSVALDANNNGFLNFISNAATTTGVRVSLAGTLPAATSGLNGVLHSNTNLITWTINMKSSRSSTNTFSSSTGYPINKYFNAVVLCASNGSLLSNSPTPGTGYAITVQKSSNNSVSGKSSVNLIKFTNGIGDVLTETSVVSRLIESPELAQTPTSITTSNNLSVKVTYNPTIDVWELFYREDPTPSPFVDPASGSLTLGGSVVDVPTLTPMTHFGYVVGLQASASAANSYQFDNFQIGLSAPPAYTAPPTVEKRQSFNSSTAPKVSNLVANGTNLKWYTTATGGTELATTTPLNYANYFVSQTINSTESTRVATQVFVGDTALKTIPLYESFADYTIGDKLILMNNGVSTSNPSNFGTGLGSWSITPSSNITDDVTIVASPIWTNAVLPAASGNAISYVGSGIDPELKFTETSSGSLYSSFVFSAADAATIVSASAAASAATPPSTVPAGVDPDKSTPTGIYSFSTENVIAGVSTTEYSASVMFRKIIGTTNKFNLGLSKSNNASECIWGPTEYDFNTQYVVVISYEKIGDADALNQVANLWINPTSNSVIPAVTLSQNNPMTSITRSRIDRIKLLQASSTSTPSIIIDEIRVANNWGQALGGAATLTVSDIKKSVIKIYPNPVSNGKFYIDSNINLEKDITIFNTLGQQVQKSKASNEGIDVSYLSKGTYFVKITEEGISVTKKLVIQ